MTKRNLFVNRAKVSVSGSSSEKDFKFAESSKNVKTVQATNTRLVPHVDFSVVDRFAKFGSAELYYKKAFDYIRSEYPYDGSENEKNSFFLSLNEPEKYIFNKIYPRTNGHAIFSAGGWGSRVGSIVSGFGDPAVKEYIDLKGAPHTPIKSFSTKRQLFELTRAGKFETKQQIADREGVTIDVVPSGREGSLKANFTEGITIEFWLKKTGFDLSKTETEVIFDLSNGEISSSAGHGRVTLSLHGSGSGLFSLTAQSGSSGFYESRIGTNLTTGSLSTFKFYSIRAYNDSSNFKFDLYVDGKRTESKTIGSTNLGEIGYLNTARLGALIASPSGSAAPAGSGKLSASLDDFRYWKVKRTSAEIENFSITPVGGGVNTDFPNTSLGVYYKFNEGITNTSSIDSKVLDYSGRINNGVWTGYSSTSRATDSAFVLSGKATSEFKDPILNSEHPTFFRKRSQLVKSGSFYDSQNTSYIRNYFPQWMLDLQADNPHLQFLTHIAGQYFDDLYLKIQELNKLQVMEYPQDGERAYPTDKLLLESRGLNVSGLFDSATVLNLFSQRDKDRLFEADLQDIKNKIYRNLYNNLNSIYKSKGAEKSFRHVLNAIGAPDDLYQINLYSNLDTIEGSGRSKSTIDKIKYLDLSRENTRNSTVYQAIDASQANSIGFLSSSGDNTKEPNYGITVESSINLPRINLDFELSRNPDRSKKKSLFGLVEYNPAGDAFLASDDVNFQVFVEKETRDSKDAKFVLTSSLTPNRVPTISSPYFKDVYDDSDWHVAVSIVPSNYPFNSSVISGSDVHNYTVIFQGQTRAHTSKTQNFYLTSSVSKAVGQALLKSQKRAFIGAFRQNFTGSVNMVTQAKFNMFNVWNIGLSRTDIDNHAADLNNKAITNSTVLRKAIEITPVNEQVSKNSTLALSWGFENLSSSNASGNFFVFDESSGSAEARTINSWFGENYGYVHSGYGFGFPQSSNSFINKEKRQNITFTGIDFARNSFDDINTVLSDDLFFQRNSAPADTILRVENSPYSVVSKDMVDYFGIFADLNEHVGAPVQRYRHNYKHLRNLATNYFKSVNTEIDVQKYFDYFKWFDSSVTNILNQLVPLSMNFDINAPNTIESHILERNKFQSKYQNIKEVNTVFEGTARGINELTYNWRLGHAPIGLSETDNTLWWQLRAERDDVASKDATVDPSRKTIRRITVTEISGSTFATRRLSRPIALKLASTKTLKGGTNFERAKSIDFTYSSLRPAGPVNKQDGVFVPQNILLALGEHFDVDHLGASSAPVLREINQPVEPNKKIKRYAKVFQGRAYKTGFGYETSKNTFSFPFNIISSSIDSGYQAKVQSELNNTKLQITNLHNDVYGPDMEKPMQGPFTDQHVGGHQSRHIKLNNGSDSWKDRPEAWKVLLGRCVANTEAIGMVGPDYPYPEANRAGESPYPLTSAHKAPFYRDGTAKRPLNIANIPNGSSLGNYDFNWEIVQTSGRKLNNRIFNKTPTVLPARLKSILPETTQIHTLLDKDHKRSGHFDYKNEFAAFVESSKNNSVIANRFSAPGDSLTMTEAFLDYDAREFSSYNDLNHRNIVVRGYGHEVSASGASRQGPIDIHGNNLSMRPHLVRHTGRFGRDSKLVADPAGLKTESPGFHKVHRNSTTEVKKRSAINAVLVPGSAQLTNTKAVKFDHTKDSVLFVGSISSVGNDVGETARSASIDEFYTNGFTFSAWVRVPGITTDASARNYYSHGCQVNDPIVRIFKPTNAGDRGKIGLEINTTSNFSSTNLVDFVTNSQPLSGDDSFHHLAVTISGSNGSLNTTLAVNIFVDGTKITHTKTGTTQPHYRKHNDLKFGGPPYFRNFDGASGAPAIDQLRSMIIIGGKSNESGAGRPTAADTFSGSMDEISLWTTPLSDVDIGVLYNSGVPCDITNSTVYTAKSGSLKAWYRMGDLGSDAIDSSNKGFYLGGTNSILNATGSGGTNFHITPISTSGSANTMAITTDRVLAGCPGQFINVETITHECEDKFDNFFVVHSLPRTENQYSWITASYVGNCSGALNVGYQPYNTWEYGTDSNGVNPYELAASASNNITTFFSSKNNEYSVTNDTISIINKSALAATRTTGTKQLNAFLNNYNGPYQAPSFVFRNMLGVNPIINRARRNNIVPYVVDSEQSTTFISESVVSNHYPVVVKKTGEVPVGTIKSAKLSFSVENDTFDSPVLRDRLRLKNERPISQTVYRNAGMDFLFTLNLFNQDSELSFKEQVYPSKQNRYLEKVKKRDSYFNFFWRDSRAERSNLGKYSVGLAHTNSRGFNPLKLPHSPPAEDEGDVRESIWPLDPIINFTTRTRLTSSQESNGTPVNRDRLPVSGAGELQNQYSQVHMGAHGGVVGSNATKLKFSTILYSRKHDVATKDSVTHPTGLDIDLVATGTPGLSIRGLHSGQPLNYTGSTQMFAGDAFWDAASQAKIIRVLPTETDVSLNARTLIPRPSTPWYDSYDEYLNGELEAVSKEYSIIPEFRISTKTEETLKNGNESATLLEIVNGTSSITLPNSSSDGDFYKTFTNSSFISDYEKMSDRLENVFNIDSIKLECSGVMKFLPYDGFYPAQRTVQLAENFHTSYGSVIDSTQQNSLALSAGPFTPQKSFRPVYQALFSPGILYNSIKSGMAVDYPSFSNNNDIVPVQLRTRTDTGATVKNTDYHLGSINDSSTGGAWFLAGGGKFNKRVPFEAILNPAAFLKGQEFKDNEVHPSCSLDFTASIASEPVNELYNLSAQNFFSAVQDFFLAPREEFEITSRRFDLDTTQRIPLQAGKTYIARITLKRSMNVPKDYSNDNFDNVTSFARKGGINWNIGSQAVYPLPQDPKFQPELKETFTMYSRPSAFGPPMSGRVRDFRRDGSGAITNNTEYLTRSVSDSLNGFNWAFTPPYYHGEAWADLILHVPTASTAGEAARGIVNYTLKEIQEDLKIKCWRIDYGITGSKGVHTSTNATPRPGELLHAGSASSNTGEVSKMPYSPYRANLNAMHITSSFDVRLLRETKGENITSQQWVIRPKFLTPMLNFNSYESNTTITTSSYGNDSIPRGMWHQFGLIPEQDEGIFATISDIPEDWLLNHPDIGNRDSVYNRDDHTSFRRRNVKSLVDALGFDTESKKLGVLKSSKEVFEGIVAIPFISTEADSPFFFKYQEEQIRRALSEYNGAGGTVQSLELQQDANNVNSAIIKTLQYARKFILPEAFDPFSAQIGTQLGSGEASLFKMFFFEFKATLSKNDLSYIWQNLMPRDFERGIDAKRIYLPSSNNRTIDLSDRVSLSDSLELKDPRILNNISRVRWMVFKVKQRGVANFSTFNQDVTRGNQARREQIDFNEISRSFQNLKVSSETLEFDPNPTLAFNWPYDYFSLTEKVKINAKLKFKN